MYCIEGVGTVALEAAALEVPAVESMSSRHQSLEFQLSEQLSQMMVDGGDIR